MKLLVVAVFLLAYANATPTRSLLGKLHKPPSDIDTYIIGGESTKPHVAPYLVSLSISKLVYAHNCAAALIGKDWILTAAHCISELKSAGGGAAERLPVYAGLHDRSQLDSAQVRYIDFAFAHKEFNGREGSPDIGLIHVSQPFVFNEHVKQITLPSFKEDYTSVVTATYGWGLNDTDDVSYVKELQVARSKVLNANECRETLPEGAPVGDKQYCVHSSACYGDGGSPLVYELDGDNVELVGITSWGYVPCGYNSHPTVYTAVPQYIDWISQVQWAYYILH